MTTFEILLLAFGVIVFVASFVMPETKSEMEAVDKALTKEQIQEILKEEMKHVHEQVSEVIDETVTYSVEKSERALERMTNDKIQAISEYSGTVLEDIHKNHEETMFLYDMLNDKHENLKEMASEVSLAVKKANETVLEVQSSSQQARAAIDEAVDEAMLTVTEELQGNEMDERRPNGRQAEDEADLPDADFEPMEIEKMPQVGLQHVIGGDDGAKRDEAVDNIDTESKSSIEDLDMLRDVLKVAKEDGKAQKKPPVKKTQVKKSTAKKNSVNQIAVHFDGGMENSNNNEMIRNLHKQGKSNMAIAKQLGLGVGEVNLVISLYEENGL